MSRRYRFSFDGFELTFAVNHSPISPDCLLLDRLKLHSGTNHQCGSERIRHRLNFSDLLDHRIGER